MLLIAHRPTNLLCLSRQHPAVIQCFISNNCNHLPRACVKCADLKVNMTVLVGFLLFVCCCFLKDCKHCSQCDWICSNCRFWMSWFVRTPTITLTASTSKPKLQQRQCTIYLDWRVWIGTTMPHYGRIVLFSGGMVSRRLVSLPHGSMVRGLIVHATY